MRQPDLVGHRMTDRNGLVVRKAADAEREAVRQSQALSQQWETQYHHLNGRHTGLEAHCQVLEDRHLRAQEDLRELRELRVQERRVSDDLRQAYGEIERLNQLIETMESTRAWRLHRWVEGLKGRR